MAKSLRASSTIKAKAFRKNNLEYQKYADSRVLRISEKLKQNYINEKVKKYLKEHEGLETVDEDIMAQFAAEAEKLIGSKSQPRVDGNGAQDIDSMDTDGATDGDKSAAKSISTSGWRDARHLNYRKAKKMKKSKKRGSFTKF
ncbi:hypothetical protein ACO0RG_003495 [Hanseniaspora osmophila]|uniref:UPF0642 protein n=1 Tax=Hanseniaspora osmophila TaxID=56408 RepID=A0A1E5RF13_9ASCO|nr:UPF0642 protein [Hanseniaspora osmophila]